MGILGQKLRVVVVPKLQTGDDRFLQGGGCAGRSPDEPGDGVMTVPEYSMRSGEIFLKREEKAGKFLFEVFSRVFPLVATA